jgi:small-conductance mechanosensitive channel
MDDIFKWIEARQWWEVLGGAIVAAFLLQVILTRVILVFTRRTKFEIDDKIVAAVRWPLFFSILFVGLYYTVWDLGPSAKVLLTLKRILQTLAILLWMKALMRIGDEVCDALSRRRDRFAFINPRSLPLFNILTSLVVLGAAVWGVLRVWDFDPTPWIASAGVAGIVIGFAAKDTLANLFAGIFIIADAPYKLGDFILLDTGERGRVTDIGIRSTRLLTRDDVEITVPNAVIGNAKIVNQTGGPHSKMRVRVNVGVAYGSDIDKVREVLLDVASSCDLIVQSPPPSVQFRQMADSALVFQIRGWTSEPLYRGRTLDQVNTAVYKRFAEEGIEIPFPQRVVHLRQQD